MRLPQRVVRIHEALERGEIADVPAMVSDSGLVSILSSVILTVVLNLLLLF